MNHKEECLLSDVDIRFQAARDRRWIVLFIVLFLVELFVVRLTFVQGSSMEGTLQDGSKAVLAIYPGVKIQRGDIVVADTPRMKDLIIKRVVGVPGDKLEIRENVLYINDMAIEEDYIKEPMMTGNTGEICLGEGEYFLMGDNRNDSADSRIIGPVQRKEIWGKVFWFLSEWRSLQPPEALASVQNAANGYTSTIVS